jgi:hypothetical protein
MPINRFLAFAEWRIGTHRSTNRGRSVRYFRLTRDHTIIWTIVMRGHYAGQPPSVRECIERVRCSKETARRIVSVAIARGYLQMHPAPDDARRKQIVPSRQCIADFENMVDGYLGLNETLGLTRARKRKTSK